MDNKLLLISLPLALAAGFAAGKLTSPASANTAPPAVHADADTAGSDSLGQVDNVPLLSGNASASNDDLRDVVERLTRIETALGTVQATLKARLSEAATADEAAPDYTKMSDTQVRFAAQRFQREGNHQASLQAQLALRGRMDADHPEWVDTTFAIAKLYEQLSKPSEADTEYRAIEKQVDDPGSLTVVGARWSRGLLLSQQGDFEGARKMMLSVGSAPMEGRSDPNHLRAWGRLRAATYAIKLGEKSTAREELVALQRELADLEADRVLSNVRKGIQYGLSRLGE